MRGCDARDRSWLRATNDSRKDGAIVGEEAVKANNKKGAERRTFSFILPTPTKNRASNPATKQFILEPIMTYFNYTKERLETEPLPALRHLYRQIGASWEVGDDQRKKANWIKAILNHQANIQERLPERERSTIFTEESANAQPGDYFRLPFKPIVQVEKRTEIQEKVIYTVTTINGDREQWEVAAPAPQPKPEPKPEPDILDKPFDQLTKEEWERLKRYPNPDNCLSIQPADADVGKISVSCPPALFLKDYTYLHYDTFVEGEGDRGSGRKLYKAYHAGQLLGIVMEASYSNKTHYVIGHQKRYSTITEAAVALHEWSNNSVAA